MERVIIRYRLKDGASRKEFIEYSIKKDQPTVKKQKGVRSFDVYEVTGQDNSHKNYHFFEDLVVDSYKAWEQITGIEEMRKNIEEWKLYGDPDSSETIYGRKN